MAVRSRGQKWQADFMVAGKRYRREFDQKTEAEAWELQSRAHLLTGLVVETTKGVPGPSPSTISGLVRFVSTHHWRDKKASETLSRNAELFAEHVGLNVAVAEALSTGRIAAYCQDMERRGRSGSTVNRHLSSISVLIKFARSQQLLTITPVLSWRKEGDGRLRYLEQWEFDKIVETLTHWGLHRDVVFYRFLVDTGARLSEALKLTWQDIDLDRKVITLVDRKSGSTTGTPLTSASTIGLAGLKHGPAGQLRGPFADFSKGGQTHLWRRLQTHLPFLVDCVPHHVFRHTTASWLVQRGVDLFRVMQFMDHASVQTTQRYAHLAPKHLAEAIKALEET